MIKYKEVIERMPERKNCENCIYLSYTDNCRIQEGYGFCLRKNKWVTLSSTCECFRDMSFKLVGG